jgi:dienelactone hydrolase
MSAGSIVLLVCFVVGTVVSLAAQPQPAADALPRRGWFGVALGPHSSGAVVTSVVAGSTAALEGVRAGDVIQAVGGSPVRTPADVVSALARPAGTRIEIDLVREGETQKKTVVLRPMLRETMPGATLEYGSVTVPDGNRLRTIVSVPDSPGRHPAVLLLQGGSCGSVDVPMLAELGQQGLLRPIAAKGFVTMRVEKSGIGDSQGPPCASIGYTQELEGYRAALAALKRHPSVEPTRVHLLGISLGGVFAPIVASESAVRGIVVYGTLAAAPPAYPGRSERFFQEFATVDVSKAWAAVDARVLVLHGQFDESTLEADHVRIAAVVNARRGGQATHRELDGLDHCWTRHESMEKSRGHCGEGQAVADLSAAVLSFLDSDR